MSPRLEFGRPSTDLQAIIRLPDSGHPDYNIAAGPIEHLVHLKGLIEEILIKNQEIISDLSLGYRRIPLGVEDMRLLEKVSFRRDLENSITVDWEYIPYESNWSGFLPSVDDDEYRWWQIAEMVPTLSVSSAKLVSVESNSKYHRTKTDYRFDEHSEFDIFVLTPEELDSLKQELTRNS